ncbi:hypothetical protein J3R83DRAFT_8715 [Lanmaoa asiatica]|nr:hypothetical protein J3R83DRAFT_8715 [Lanmaoa asiatica]
MTLLHVYFILRNQQAFQRLLERDRLATNPQAGQSTSASKSWTRKNIASALEVNAFDHLGRTVLHLACASTEPASLEYSRMLLAHPSINVNLADKENHWTALHRALYAGNIEAAIMLLKRTDTDASIKDVEGYTAFDLYNSTVRTTNPTSLEDNYADLLTWGANRNAALGLGDSNDRAHPDRVVILNKDAPLPASRTLEERFRPVKVRDVSMSKLHTGRRYDVLARDLYNVCAVILTDEPRDNVRLCGFGSGGRLGPFSHTLYTPTPLALSSHSIVSVALGQDHTLALTSAGEVISWGLNRFAQLGYVVESGQGGSADESIQTTPRKIGHLKKEFLKGIAACKTASACWSDSDVWTWGTNGGQLGKFTFVECMLSGFFYNRPLYPPGYSNIASPVQALPRKVSIITQPIRGIVISETAMICLFMTGEVVCVWNGGVSKINFPAHAFPSDISMVYRPPHIVRAPAITKVACCDELFAALSSNGEVFTFSLPTTIEAEGSVSGVHAGGSRGQVKPQRAWALRRQFSSVRVRRLQLGLSSAGLNACLFIENNGSGHVFVRSRNLKGSTTSNGTKAFRFQRIAHVQRAIAVCANSTGAFGALRIDYKPPPISVTGRHFSADMAAIAPYNIDEATILACQDMKIRLDATIGADDDLEDSSILDDISEVAKLMTVLSNQVNQVVSSTKGSKHGADLAVRIGTIFEIPAHRVVLAARCMPLREILGGGVLHDKSSKVSVMFTPQVLDASLVHPVLHFVGITPLSLLILLHYLYADEVLAVWDLRIGSLFEAQFSSMDLSATQVKADLTTLAQLLYLPHLTSVLQWLFDQAQLLGSSRRNVHKDPLAPDVALHLADRIVYTHSAVLRARSAFFAAFFADPDWTVQRRDDAGVVDVEMGHHKWQVMQFVLSFVCFGEETMFGTLEFLDNVDELIEFMFLVISAANELLLTRLVLLCSRIVLKYLNVYNACYLLTDAVHFNAVDLVESIQSYMTANIEMLLESRILDDLDSSSGAQKLWSTKELPKMSPPDPAKKLAVRQSRLYSPTTSPVLHPSLLPPGDEIFAMDDADGGPSLNLNSVQASGGEETLVSVTTVGSAKPGWKKNPATPRTDLKVIMAEAENGKRQVHARTLDNQGSNLNASANIPTSASQGAGPSRQPGLIPGHHWRSDTPPTPRRVPSDPATPPRSHPPLAPTPNRTGTVAQATQATQASPGPSRPIMGPVITPVRQTQNASGSTSTSSSSRKPSLGGAWTLPPVQPIAAPTELQGTTSTPKDKRSLRDIQEEERARQQEADFLKWWAAEEERVRLETLEQGQGQGRAMGTGVGANHGNKSKGGKARPRKAKAEIRRNPSNDLAGVAWPLEATTERGR